MLSSSLSPGALDRDLDDVMLRTGLSWEMLRGESLFITGGTGLFGRWLLESLARANQEFNLNLKVTVLTRNEQGFREKAPHLVRDPFISFHHGDVKNFDFPKGCYTYLIHGATTSADETFQGEEPLRKFDTLVLGTRRALDFAAHCGIRRVLFLSSGSVYGIPADGMLAIPESYAGAPHTTDPDSALGQAKRAAEFVATCYAQKYGWELVIARCFSFVGPFMPLNIHYAIGNFVSNALWDDVITVKGDGSPVRSYMYMSDLVVWLLKLLDRGRSGHVYNVGSDRAISIRDLAYRVQVVVNPEKPVVVLGRTPYSVGNELRNLYVPDISKARAELGLEVWTELDAAIKLTAAAACDMRDRI